MTTSTGNTSTGRVLPHDPAVLRNPLHSCPTCGAAALSPVVVADAARVHFRCSECSRCWRVELGYVQRVHPDRCDGCPSPQQCASAYTADHGAQPSR